MGPTESRALDVAGALMAQSDALDRAAAERRQADLKSGDPVVEVVRPGGEASVGDRREWALQRVMAAGVISKPTDRELVDVVVGGQVVKMERPYTLIFGPHNADAADLEWSRRRKAQEDQVLIAFYGLKACRDAGIL